MGRDHHLFFDGLSLSQRPLELDLSGEGLVAFAQDGSGLSGLYHDASGNMSVVRSRENTVPLPNPEGESRVKIQESYEAQLQSAMMFGVMMVALFMVLRWRQETEGCSF